MKIVEDKFDPDMYKMAFFALLLLLFLGEMRTQAQAVVKYKDKEPIPLIDTVVYVKFQFEVPLKENQFARKNLFQGEYPLPIPQKRLQPDVYDQKTQKEFFENTQKIIWELLLKNPLSTTKFESLEDMLFYFSNNFQVFAIDIQIQSSFIDDYIFLKRSFKIFSPGIVRGEYEETFCRAFRCWFNTGQTRAFDLQDLLDHTELELLRTRVLEKIKLGLSIPPGEFFNTTGLEEYQLHLSKNFYIQKGKLAFFYEVKIIEEIPFICEITYQELAQLLGENHALVQLVRP